MVTMKKIENYQASKYNGSNYTTIENDIYLFKKRYVTSLSFVQEPKFDEGDNSNNISQYPLEDILNEFSVYVSDFYEEINNKKNEECILEFASSNLENIKKLRTIIGKHVYNKKKNNTIELVIE